jgi:hypothetical protein
MEMFLMVLALSLLGVAVSAGLFAAATRDVRDQSVQAPRLAETLPAPRFFGDAAAPEWPRAQALPPRVPIEALLLQLERHIRLEHAAAESFLQRPTRESLHSPTMSPLVH